MTAKRAILVFVHTHFKVESYLMIILYDLSVFLTKLDAKAAMALCFNIYYY